MLPNRTLGWMCRYRDPTKSTRTLMCFRHTCSCDPLAVLSVAFNASPAKDIPMQGTVTRFNGETESC